MRVLITGVTGFMGSHLAERLLAEGVAVRGLARRPADAAFLARQGAEIVPGDLAERAGLEEAVRDCQAVLHTAAWTGGPGLGERQAWTINVAATGWLLQAAQNAGVQRFVYFSSVAVYGLNAAPLIDESAPTPPVGQLYPDSKIAAETLVAAAQADGLPTTIIRPASTYGPRGTAWTTGPVEQIQAGRLVLLGEDRGLVNPGYIDNVVDGVLLALRSPAAVGETFNLCDGTAITYREFYGRYAAMLGRERLPVYPAWLARGAVSPPGRWLRRLLGRPAPGPWSYHFRFNPSRFSIAKAQRVLGYAPAVDLDEGMRRTEQWLRAREGLAAADRFRQRR
ncbi:MAG: NAD(P)-dependent oxidoreductase [Anaerolinea sp.]|nr:NAD(P)-dependent oxidoreductase [Anaerolinea sp.]